MTQIIQRAWSTLEIKAMGDANGKRTFTGIATTPSTDRMGDIVEPKGMQIKLPTPLLWQHNSSDPVGWVNSAKVTDAGITVTCEIANVAEPGPLQDRLNTAWQMLTSGLVRGLSIGFNSIESQQIDGTWGLRFVKTELLELSCVTVPANQDCSINAIKSIDARALAAIGAIRKTVRLDGPRTPSTGTPHSDSRAALGLTRRGVVRLGDSPGASGPTRAKPA